MPEKKERVNLGVTVRVILTDNNTFHPVLSELIRIMNKETNEIILNGEVKNRITEIVKKIRKIENAKKLPGEKKINLDIGNIEAYINKFVQQDHLLKIAESTYMVNPRTAFNNANYVFKYLDQKYQDLLSKNFQLLNKKLKKKIQDTNEEIKQDKVLNNFKDILNNSKLFER